MEMSNEKQVVAKITKMVEEHPDANIKFKARSPISYCGCLVTPDCIEYNKEQNLILIG